MDFIEQLRRHIGFLARSCAAYDAGYDEEALRIAVSLRVLFHDAKSSTALLTHLGLTSSALVLTTIAPGYIENRQDRTFTISIPVFLNGLGERSVPLDRSRRHEFITAVDWWDEIIAYPNCKVSRKDVVLAAANQDGGAHVDAAPGKKTETLISGFLTIKRVVAGESVEERIKNDHFPLLRQFGYEVLNSPELTEK